MESYKYISVKACPQEMHLIEDSNSFTSRAIESELRMAYAAPVMYEALLTVKETLYADQSSRVKAALAVVEVALLHARFGKDPRA